MEWYYVWWPWLTSKRVTRVWQHQLSFLLYSPWHSPTKSFLGQLHCLAPSGSIIIECLPNLCHPYVVACNTLRWNGTVVIMAVGFTNHELHSKQPRNQWCHVRRHNFVPFIAKSTAILLTNAVSDVFYIVVILWVADARSGMPTNYYAIWTLTTPVMHKASMITKFAHHYKLCSC